MWDIANMMLNWDLCCECWTALNKVVNDFWIPIRCNECHWDRPYIPREWIHSEKSVMKRMSDPKKELEIYVEYNLYVAITMNRKLLYNRKELVWFIADFALAFVENEEVNTDIWTQEK